jgi:hypothetical protein
MGKMMMRKMMMMMMMQGRLIEDRGLLVTYLCIAYKSILSYRTTLQLNSYIVGNYVISIDVYVYPRRKYNNKIIRYILVGVTFAVKDIYSQT